MHCSSSSETSWDGASIKQHVALPKYENSAIYKRIASKQSTIRMTKNIKSILLADAQFIGFGIGPVLPLVC